MEISDLLNLLNSDIITKISSLFSLTPNKPENNYSASYWQLPSYSTSPPPQKENQVDILELVKLLLPLLVPKETKKSEPKSDFQSTILSLPKVDK